MTNSYTTGRTSTLRWRQLALAALLAVGATAAQGQNLNYSLFGAQNTVTAFNSLGSTGTVIPTANTDDANSALTPIGFQFNYNGQVFTDFVLNTNGYIKLGGAPAAPYFQATSQAAGNAAGPLTSAETNLILPFNEDLEAGSSPTEYRYNTTGTAPNRVTTIQWSNVSDKARSNGTTVVGKQYANISFQVKLYETTGVIEFVYGTATAGSAADAFKTVAVGLKGSGSSATQLIAVTKGSTQTWDLASFVAGLYTGNGHNIRSTVRPDAGRTYRFSPSAANDAAVLAVYTLGKLPIPIATPHVMQAVVRNVGTGAMSNVQVTAAVAGANTYTNTKTITSLAVGASAVVTFDQFTPTNNGTNNVTVTLGNDDVASNNTRAYAQQVQATTFAHYDASVGSASSVGFNTGSGLLTVKHTTNAPRTVTAVAARLEDTRTVGNTVYGVVCDASGAILGRTADYVVTAGDIGTTKTFTFTTPVNIPAGSFFGGIAQTANTTTGYFPVGSQEETPTRPDAFFSIPLAGGNPTDVSTNNLGRLMIEVVTGAPATCAPPTAVTAAATSATAATVSFTGPANGTSYTIIYGPTGFNPATGGTTLTPNPTTSPATITGLAASTTYQVYIRANCGATDQSVLAGPFSFTTQCTPPIINTFPYTESFEGIAPGTLPCGYTVVNANGDASTWQVVAAFPGTGTNSIRYNYSTPNAADDWFFTPQIFTRAGFRYQLSFKYRKTDPDYTEGLEVKYGNAATVAAMTNTLFTNPNIANATAYVTANGTSTPAVAVITPTANGFIHLGFHAISPADQFNMYVDDIQVDQVVTSASDALARAVAVYPNPSQGEMTVQVTNANAKNGLEVVVTNMLGQQVFTTSVRDNGTSKVNLGQLANGMYQLRVSNGAEYMIRTISIQK
ncbi:T9SS type A sorting domain-containing protein [Hymenobacter sp. B81]|uniref:T9SS type A sorting domain-containing protein n=1 Tax=Hymenobacter sp. B81 TaxID=3344878 RepID=UPI0037DDBECC